MATEQEKIDQDTIDQQRRRIVALREEVGSFLTSVGRLEGHVKTYERLGLGDDAILKAAAFDGTGTWVFAYREAIRSIKEISTLLDAGYGAHLERIAQ